MNYPEATRCGVRRFSELPDYVGVETTGGPCGWRVLVGVDGEFESRIDSMPPLPGDFDGDGVCDYMGSILHEGVGPRLAIVAFGVDHALREVDGDFERDSGRAWVRDLDGDGIDEIVVVTEGLPDGWQRGDDVAILVEVLRISPVLDRFDRVAALPLLYAANRRDYAAVDARAGVVGVRGTTALVSTSWENSLLLIDFGNLDRGSDLEVQECGVGSAALVCAPSVHVAARVEMTAAGWAIVAAS